MFYIVIHDKGKKLEPRMSVIHSDSLQGARDFSHYNMKASNTVVLTDRAVKDLLESKNLMIRLNWDT